jgi:hypothetical protein
MKRQESPTQETLKTLLESLVSSNAKITITIEPNNGLTGSQIEEAREKGRLGQDIYFKNTDSTL